MKQVSPQVALDGKYPEWLIFVITGDPDGPDDIMPAGWCMLCSGEPLMMAVGLGRQRHTLELIRKTGEFNLAWAGPGQHEMVTFTGTRSGRDTDKIAALGLTVLPAAVNRAPLIEGCARTVECKLRHEYPSGDHVIVVGEVVAAHVADPPLANLVNFGGWYSVAEAATPKPAED